MNAADFLDAILPEYRAEMGPIVGFDFIDRFVAQNRPRLLQSLEPLMALLAAERAPVEPPEACEACGTELRVGAHGVGCPRCADVEIEAPQAADDPDAVTPEKDAIVWAAFMKLVNQKRREFGMDEIEATESLPRFEGKSVGRINDRGWGSEVAADKMTARARALSNREYASRSRERAVPIAITLRHPRRRDLTAMVTASASEPGRFQLTWVDDHGPSGHTTRDTPEEAVRHAVEEGYRLDTANTSEAREMVERVQRAREDRAAQLESWLREESLPRGRETCEQERRQAEHIASKSRACATVNARRNERLESMPSCGCGPSHSEMVESLPAPGDFDSRGRTAPQTRSELLESLPRKDLLHAKELTAALHFAPFKRGDYVIRLGDMLGMEGELGGYVKEINRNDGTAKIEQDNGEIKPWPLDSLLHDTKENRAKREDFDDQIAADASVRVDQAIMEWKAR